MPETLEYDISSFLFKADRPLHPQRFRELLKSGPAFNSVVRAKGRGWLASPLGNDNMMKFSLAGNMIEIVCSNKWFTVGEDHHPVVQLEVVVQVQMPCWKNLFVALMQGTPV